MLEQFMRDRYLVRRKVFEFFGRTFYIYGDAGELVLYSRLKAFKLREDIRLYTGTDMQEEVLTIKARQIIDFSATYDVFDPKTATKIGGLRRKGLKSMLKDEWIFLNTGDQEIGLIKEDSLLLALIRRGLTNLVPQKYHGQINGIPVCTFKQNFNPFVLKLAVDFSQDGNNILDRRLGLAAAVLICAIEGRQN